MTTKNKILGLFAISIFLGLAYLFYLYLSKRNKVRFIVNLMNFNELESDELVELLHEANYDFVSDVHAVYSERLKAQPNQDKIAVRLLSIRGNEACQGALCELLAPSLFMSNTKSIER